ncbi:MAG TPA: hypothetical protein VKT83_10140 [bacterium]|nr:hypothetical protein [bacterium]
MPPPDLRRGNQLPTPGTASIPLTVAGSGSASISTDDAQVAVVVPEAAFAGRADETSVQVRITPVDPKSLSSPPPGLRFDGNGYAIVAAYARSRELAVLRKPATIVLRYPMHATILMRNIGQEWRPLPANTVPSTLQIFATTNAWGTFIAAAPGGLNQRSSWTTYVAATGALLGGLSIGWLLRWRASHAGPSGGR